MLEVPGGARPVMASPGRPVHVITALPEAIFRKLPAPRRLAKRLTHDR